MKPRLLVILRPETENTICSTLGAEIPDIAPWRNRDLSSMEAAETIQVVKWRGMKIVMHVASHPYSDFAKDDAGKAEIADRLKRAWEIARPQ